MITRRALKVAIAALAFCAFAASGPRSDGATSSGGKTPSGSITITQVQIAFIGSANLGSGNLTYRGRTYGFSVGGLGVGGFGISRMEARGEVYNLRRLSQFSGTYGQARAGIVVGDVGTGDLWLQNSEGVYIHLKAKRQGLALTLGVDGVQIQLK